MLMSLEVTLTDDVIIYRDMWSAHLNQISKFFGKLIAANLTVNLQRVFLVIPKSSSLARTGQTDHD